jgi:hypothetical protein
MKFKNGHNILLLTLFEMISTETEYFQANYYHNTLIYDCLGKVDVFQ